LNHGIDLSADGKTLFVSSSSTVFAYPYDSKAGTVGERKTIITGMLSGGHSTRTILTSKKNPDVLVVSVGSNGNIDTSTSQITYGRSQLRTFSIAKITQASVAYTAGEVLGWGLRNSVGVTENPVTGGIVSFTSLCFGDTGVVRANPLRLVVCGKQCRQHEQEQRRHSQHESLRGTQLPWHPECDDPQQREHQGWHSVRHWDG
jgi:hypothetical protein